MNFETETNRWGVWVSLTHPTTGEQLSILVNTVGGDGINFEVFTDNGNAKVGLHSIGIKWDDLIDHETPILVSDADPIDD